MHIAVVGTGYVGLVTGSCFAELGNDVVCVDIDEKKIAQMRAGQVPIYEPQLQDIFERNIAEERLKFTTNLSEGLEQAEIVFLALPTPPDENGAADLSYVLAVADDIGPLLSKYAVIVNKSTVPVGTATEVRKRIASHTNVPFDVVSNPEFLREGFAVRDFMEPDRIVVGTSSAKARKVMSKLYAPITDQQRPLYFMNEHSAELTKYAANSFLSMKITFINEIANLCERLGADVDMVRLGIGSDERIGHRFLFPGIGYGGSCFPKDVLALLQIAHDNKYPFELLDMVVQLNTRQRQILSRKVRNYFGDDLKGKTFALWGIAFKPDTDDIRQAPALDIIDDLTAAGAIVQAYDPEAMPNAKNKLMDNNRVKLLTSEYDALKGADALLIATEWSQFKSISPDRIKQFLNAPIIFDGRNIFDLEAMDHAGFYYESIGRPIVRPPRQKTTEKSSQTKRQTARA